MKRIEILLNPMPWCVAFDQLFLFELEKQQLQLCLPAYLQATEIRPQVGLMGIGIQMFQEGNYNLPSFKEVYWFIVIAPELRYNMPMPNFACYICSVASDHQDFITHAASLFKMPSFPNVVDITIDQENDRFCVKDETGPILELSTSPEARNKSLYHKKIWYQNICAIEGASYIRAASWEGRMFEYQKNNSVGKLHSHPFFQGLEVEELASNCYCQTITAQQTESTLTFYEPLSYR